MRKKILFVMLAVGLVVGLTVPMSAVVAANSVEYIETLYLTDSLGAHTHDGSRLYSVEIDDVNNWAVLTMLLDETDLSDSAGFDQVDAIAASPDGGIIYLIDSDTGKVGCYNVGTDAFSILPFPTGKLTIVLAACSSDGTLYAARNADDSLYTIDTTTGVATLVGPIKREVSGTKYTVDVSGADIVFGEDGVLYFWANNARTHAPEGLYTLTIPGTPGDVMAVYLGIDPDPTPDFSFTGLAIRGGGAGDLLASAGDDNIYLVDKSDGQLSTPYEMRLGGAHYNYWYGDMTIGELEVEEGKCGDLIAGQHIDVGDVIVSNDGTYLYVTYEITDPDWVITETHLYVGKNTPPTTAPGQFPYDDADATSVSDTAVAYTIPLGDVDSYSMKLNKKGEPTGVMVADGDPGVEPCNDIYIAAHAVVRIDYYETVVYGMERYTATVYGVDVLTGESWKEFDTGGSPAGGSATPNGLAYDAENGRFYYSDYNAAGTPDTLYFWDTSQHVAGTLLGEVADAGFYDGKYYYITGPPSSDDLYEVTFNADGTINTQIKLDDIAGGVHGWTFNGDIAVKDGVVYGWGLCGPNNDYEFFTYDLTTSAFTLVTPSYQSSLQLAFGSDGTLYGHRSGGDGAFYVIDTTNGNVSKVTPTPDPALRYTDCASGEICVPITETAWGYCEENGGELPGANWATYISYHVH